MGCENGYYLLLLVLVAATLMAPHKDNPEDPWVSQIPDESDTYEYKG